MNLREHIIYLLVKSKILKIKTESKLDTYILIMNPDDKKEECSRIEQLILASKEVSANQLNGLVSDPVHQSVYSNEILNFNHGEF